MAYAAVISLKQTINELLLSPSPASSSTRETLEFAYDQSTSLQKVLERFNDSSGRCSERLNDLEGQMRDVANQVEDALEFHELDKSCSWEEVEQEISSLAEAVKKMEVDYIEEISKPVLGCIVSSYTDFGVEMVGNSAEFQDIRAKLLSKMRPTETWIMSYLGEVGSGRTHSARIIFEDQSSRGDRFFDCCAWVTVGNHYQIERVMMRILDQILNMNPAAGEGDDGILFSRWELCSLLRIILVPRRYLIVLDDVHDEEVLRYLEIFCPDEGNGSLVIYTTSSYRLSQLADMIKDLNEPKFFFEETTWFMLREVIFFDESMAPEHAEYGKRIIEMCPPGLIPKAKVLMFLYKTKNSPDEWSKVAADKENHIFMVEDEISEMGILRRDLQSLITITDDGRNMAFPLFFTYMMDSYEIIEPFKNGIQPERFFDKMQILSLWGMAGIGKTTLAKKIFKDVPFMCRFDHCVWVTLGLNYHSEEILIDILAQIYPSTDKMLIKEDEELARNLCAQLASKRCFIVLDDLWSKDPLIRLKDSFPDIKGTTMVTTRLAKVAKFGRDDTFYEMKLLNKEESWCLLREKVFAQGLCSPELEKVGRKIAEKCEGLPLLILTVADQLLKVEITEEYWNSVALGKEKSVFINAHREINKNILSSYERLPQYLKACFLYMGVFCNDYKIPTSKLTDLWILERFLEPNSSNAANIVADLVDDSLILAQRRVSDLQFKTCRLHPIFWHLSNSVVASNKLFYGINSYEDCSIESMKTQRRLCIRNNVLLGIKDVCNMAKSSSKSRSLLCTGPPHQYPVSLYFGSRLLRVLDAVSIRWYEFPVEVVELIHLRYLGLTCNGKLPTSISKLLKLQHLIVNRYINTKSSENCSPLPVEIWDMKELKHLQVMGGLLPNPKCGDGLPNLSTLLDVSAQSCTKKVIKRIPNLKRLSIQIELAPNEKGNPFRSLNRISRLRRLESLKCAVTNPHIRSDIVPPAPISMFPSSLKELSLSGFGYPWEYMSTIENLKKLEVLKLKQYAFRGPKWGYKHNNVFYGQLKFLLVEDTDLVNWEPNATDFMKLKRVSFKHCYKLQELPPVGFRQTLKMIEIVDCNPLFVRWAERERYMMRGGGEVKVHLSWIEEKRED